MDTLDLIPLMRLTVIWQVHNIEARRLPYRAVDGLSGMIGEKPQNADQRAEALLESIVADWPMS